MKNSLLESLGNKMIDSYQKRWTMTKDHQFLYLNSKQYRVEKSQLELWAILSDGSTSLLTCVTSFLISSWKCENCIVRTLP